MFYTFVQSTVEGRTNGEILVCIQADSFIEANERATYYGLNLDVQEHPHTNPRWTSARSDRLLEPNPRFRGELLSRFGVPWVIFYRNDNMVSSLATPLNEEPE